MRLGSRERSPRLRRLFLTKLEASSMPSSSGIPPGTDRARIVSEIARGANAVFRNADELWSEACALAQLQHFSRALFLHQISLEECAKVDMLGAWATSLLLDHDVDG